MQNLLLEKLKEEANSTNFTNLEEKQNRIQNVFSMLHTWNELYPQKELNENIDKDEINKSEEGESSPGIAYAEKTVVIPKENIDKQVEASNLVRKLRGGTVQINKQEVYIPESIIRKLNLDHGDLIGVQFPAGENPIFTLVEKAVCIPNDNPRGVVEYAVISEEMMGKNLTASKEIIDGECKNIKIDGETPYTFIISETDREKFKLEPNMIVSIAYLKKDPLVSSVSWCHIEQGVPHTTPKPASYYKNSNSKIGKQSTWTDDELGKIKNRSFLMIGSEFKNHDFQQAAKEGGFNLTLFSGWEDDVMISSAISKHEGILLATDMLSHSRCEIVRAAAKNKKIPCRTMPTSLAGFKRGIIDCIDNSDVIFDSVFNGRNNSLTGS